jgi:hypothetical protein
VVTLVDDAAEEGHDDRDAAPREPLEIVGCRIGNEVEVRRYNEPVLREVASGWTKSMDPRGFCS